MADATRVTINHKDSNGDTISNSYKDINPALTESGLRGFVSEISNFVDGDLVKFIRTDSTTYYPIAAGSGE